MCQPDEIIGKARVVRNIKISKEILRMENPSLKVGFLFVPFESLKIDLLLMDGSRKVMMLTHELAKSSLHEYWT
jgi:hypothetical protein